MGHSLFQREFPVEYGLDILSPQIGTGIAHNIL